MTEPFVTILATCPDGHQTEMLPRNCVVSLVSEDPTVLWQCPRCTGELAGKEFKVAL